MLYRVLENIFVSKWFRIIESVSVLSIIYYISSQVIPDIYVIACILIPTILLFIYVETVFKSPWPRVLLPYSLANSTLLAALMVYDTIPENMYKWFIVGYALAIFVLFHSLSRMFSLFLYERSTRFRIIIQGSMIDIGFFVIISSILLSILIYYRAIMDIYGILLIIYEILLLFLVPWLTNKHILRNLLERILTILGYYHPQEPEIERLYFEFSSITVLFILVIPAIMAYTSTTFERRAFIPMVLLAVYETIVMAYYIITYVISIHGAFIETLMGDRIVEIEYSNVVKKWRDLAWFINISLNSYLKMKYLNALFMLFQGLEILSLRVGDRELYYGPIYDILVGGREVIEKNKRLKKFVIQSAYNEALEVLTPDNVYILEANWKPFEKTGLENDVRKALGSVMNIYCKMHEFEKLDRMEISHALKNSIDKFDKIIQKAKGRALEQAIKYKRLLEEVMAKEEIKPSDLEFFIIKQPLTINMLRNYMVHGQLYKNALVYKNNRIRADKIFNKPAILYAIYTLIIAYVFTKHRELLET